MQSLSHFAGHLTLLYDETKKKALSSTGKNENVPALSHLDRKLRIQKDRLVTWGLEWTRQDKGPGGDIDASVAQAGMTETVTSVLGNIKEVLEQAEKIRAPVSAWPIPEKLSLTTNVEAKYEDLIKDLTSSVDILYEISTTRRAIASGSHPTFSSDQPQPEFAPGTIASDPDTKSPPFKYPSFGSSELTLVNPSFTRPALSPYAGLPLSIDPQALILPAEAPPPYESYGVPSATRMIGRVIRSKVPETVRRVLPTSSDAYVLVEYANYDLNHELLYHEAGIAPPLQRLETLALALAAAQSRRNRSLILLGYFEDPHQPRIGLVYDFLGAVHGGKHADDLSPVSLLNLVQSANKGPKTADVTNAMPFLEDRFKVALNIAQNLRDLHAEGFSHGNLNSGSVIFFRQGQDNALRRGELHLPTLSAFDVFSGTGIERRHNSTSRLNITKHPHDHNSSLSPVRAIQYDLYGLALLLLEVGLWTPLHDLYKQKYSLKDFKLRIEKIWIPRLASKCGSLYMRAVQTCIRLSDDTDMDRIDVDALYGSIIGRLQRCCFLDESEPILSDNASPQDQAALWQSLASNRQEETPESVSRFRRVMESSQGHVTSPALSIRSGTTLSGDTIREAGREPAREISTIMSRHHHHMMPRPTARKGTPVNAPPELETVFPFREFRKKVILMQRCWRDCRRRRADGSNMPAVHKTISAHPFNSHASPADRRKSIMETRRSSESVRQCQVFPIRHPQPALEDWHSNLGLRITRIVERALKDSTEPSSIDLVGFGQDCSTAKPTIVVTCASTARVKAALKNKFDYDRSKFDLKVRKGRISLARGKGSARNQLAKRASGAATDSDSESEALNPYFQQRPLCGASIGAYLPNYGHLDPVSYGGVVVVEQGGKMESFGMSVHHMLDPPEEDEQTSSPSTSDTSSNASQSGSDLEVSDTSDYVETSDEDSEYLSSEFESDISDGEPSTSNRARLVAQQNRRSRHEPGDKPGIAADSVPAIQVTQPAFIDAWNQDLHADDAPLEELDDDHLSSYRLGSIYASSGLRRVTRNGMRHEIDWALIKLDPPRLQPYNLIQGGKRYSPADTTKEGSDDTVPFTPNLEQPVCRQKGVYSPDEDIYPQDFVPSSQLAGLDVHCFGRTSGLATGTINAYVSFVKIRGRRSFSACWSVLSASSAPTSTSPGKGRTGTGRFGVGGDSGAWIVDNNSSRVCGHVLAERNGMAYLCSMQLLLEDMKATLGASRILLPGAETTAVDAAMAATAATAAAATTTTTLGIATQLGESLSRLDVGDRGTRAGVERSGFVRTRTGHWKTTHIPVASRGSSVGGVGGVVGGVKGEGVRLSGGKHRQALRT